MHIPAPRLLLVAFAATLCTAAPALAAEEAPLLQLEASATQQVRRDQVQITLSSDVEGASQGEVSRKLNAALQKVTEQARAVPALRVSNGPYWVSPQATFSEDDKTPANKRWRGNAQLMLESADFDAAAEFARSVSDIMAVGGLNFVLSNDAREAARKQLLTQAAQAFRDKAEHAARAFGFSRYEIRTLSLDGASAPMPKAMGMMRTLAAASMEDNAMPMEPGDATVRVSVTGAVALY